MVLDKYPVLGTSFSAPAVAAFIALILQYVDKVVSDKWKLRTVEEKYKSLGLRSHLAVITGCGITFFSTKLVAMSM